MQKTDGRKILIVVHFQDFLCVLCNKTRKSLSPPSYLNTDCANNVRLSKTPVFNFLDGKIYSHLKMLHPNISMIIKLQEMISM